MRTERDVAGLPPPIVSAEESLDLEQIKGLPEEEQISLVVHTLLRIAIALEKLAKAFTRQS